QGARESEVPQRHRSGRGTEPRVAEEPQVEHGMGTAAPPDDEAGSAYGDPAGHPQTVQWSRLQSDTQARPQPILGLTRCVTLIKPICSAIGGRLARAPQACAPSFRPVCDTCDQAQQLLLIPTAWPPITRN